ncbi:MAG: VgrG-related protein [Anaerolineae bacterium]
MSEPIAELTSQIYVKRAGSVVQNTIMVRLTELVVDQHCQMPNMFMLRFQDRELQLIDEGIFDLHEEIEIGATINNKPSRLMSGIITAIEPSFSAEGSVELVVRGYDKSIQLYREPKSRAYRNSRDSDIAQKIAGEAHLRSSVQATSITYEHIYQNNKTDLAFLQERAWRIGYEVYVKGDTLYFQPPKGNQSVGAKLTWGENSLSIRPRISVSEKVDEVQIRGWDAKTQKPLIGRSKNGDLMPKISSGKQIQDNDSSHYSLVVTDLVPTNQNEANLLADARMNERSGAFLEVEGSVFRRPDVEAGTTIELDGIGERFSGEYLVTSATHSYSASAGLYTRFTVRGLRSGLLTEQMAHLAPVQKYNSPVTAIVSNNKDPQGWGRVRLNFPWLEEKLESDWARVSYPGAGAETSGFEIIPAVNDEVIVIFEHGDFNRPLVIGSLYNGKNKASQSAHDSKDDPAEIRQWRSKKGHVITLHDKHGQEKVEVQSNGGHQILLDDKSGDLEINAAGGQKITLAKSGEVTIEGKSVKVKSSGQLSLESGSNMNIKANGKLDIKGSIINLN